MNNCNVTAAYNGLNFIFKDNTLSINGKKVLNGEKIIGVYIFDSCILTLTEDLDVYNKSPAESYSENRKGNVFAFDFNGDLLWSVNDLIDNIHFPFTLVYAVDKERRKIFSDFGVVFHDDCEYCVCLDHGGDSLIIDLTNGKALAKKHLCWD